MSNQWRNHNEYTALQSGRDYMTFDSLVDANFPICGRTMRRWLAKEGKAQKKFANKTKPKLPEKKSLNVIQGKCGARPTGTKCPEDAELVMLTSSKTSRYCWKHFVLTDKQLQKQLEEIVWKKAYEAGYDEGFKEGQEQQLQYDQESLGGKR